MSLYQDGMDGFGMDNVNSVMELRKALDAGYDRPVDDGGGALRLESLENSLKALSYGNQHLTFWNMIKGMSGDAFSTVEEFTQLTGYGSEAGGFVPEGVLPEEDDASYQRQHTFIKFLGTTRVVSHPMTLVRQLPPEAKARENSNGILWLLRKLERALFWGNSSLGHVVSGSTTEHVEFDGLDQLIPTSNTIDLKGVDISESYVNQGAQLVLDNYGIPNTALIDYGSKRVFNESYLNQQRIIIPDGNSGTLKAGLSISKFTTQAGDLAMAPCFFLRPTPKPPASATSSGAPDAPASIAAVGMTGTDADWVKTGAGAGTYFYQATACNRYGESAPVIIGGAVTVGSGDLAKHVPLTVTAASPLTTAPEYYNIYRSQESSVYGTQCYWIGSVAAADISAGGTTPYSDVNWRMPNTSTAFIGEMSPQVLMWKQLLPLVSMPLAQIAPSIRWIILMYGAPVMYAPMKWARMLNVKNNLSKFSV